MVCYREWDHKTRRWYYHTSRGEVTILKMMVCYREWDHKTRRWYYHTSRRGGGGYNPKNDGLLQGVGPQDQAVVLPHQHGGRGHTQRLHRHAVTASFSYTDRSCEETLGYNIKCIHTHLALVFLPLFYTFMFLDRSFYNTSGGVLLYYN